MSLDQTSPQSRQMVGSLRVLDQGAFDELASRLDRLIGEAGESSRRVQSLVDAATETTAGGERTKSELDQRLVLSGRVLKITREQLERIKSALVEMSSRQRDIDEVASRLRDQLASFQEHAKSAAEVLERRLADAVGGLEGQIDAIHEQLGETAETVHRRAADAVADLASHRAATELAQARADRVLAAATALGERFGDLERRVTTGIEGFEKGLQHAVEEVRAGGAQAERASSKLDEQVFALKSRVSAFADGLERWIKPALAEIDARRHDVDRATTELRQRFEALDARIDESLSGLDRRIGEALLESRHGQEQVEQTAQRLGDGLAGLDTRIRQTADSFHERLIEPFAELRQRIEGVAERLESRVDQGGRQVREEIDGALRGHTAALEARIGAAAEESARQVNQVIAAAEGRIRSLADDAVAHRAQIADTQKDHGAAIDRLAQDCRAAAETLVHHVEGTDTQSSALQERIGELRTELRAMGERMPHMAPALDALEKLNRRSGKIDEKLDGRLLGLETRLKSIDDRIADRMTEALARMGETAEVAGRGAEEARAGAAAVGERVERTLREALMALEKSGAGTQEKAAAHRDRIMESQGQLFAALSRIEEKMRAHAAELERRTAPVEDLAGRIDGLADRLTLGLAERSGRIEESLAEAMEDLGQRDADGAERAAALEHQVSRLAAEVGDAGAKAAAVTPAIAELRGQVKGLGERLDDIAGAGEIVGPALAELRGQLGLVSDRLDEISGAGDVVAPAIAELRTEIAGLAEAQLAALERRIDDLTEHIEALGGRITEELRQDDGTQGFEQVVGDVRSEIAQLGRTLGGRVDAAVAAMAAPPRTVAVEPAPAPVATATITADISATIERHFDEIQQRVAAIVEDASGKVSGNGDGAALAEIEKHLCYLQEQVTALGARLANFEPGLGGNAPALPGLPGMPAPGGPGSEKLMARLEDLQKQLGSATDRLDQRVGQILAAVERVASAPLASAAAPAAAPAPTGPTVSAFTTPAPADRQSSPKNLAPHVPPAAKRSGGGSLLASGTPESRRLINSLIAAINSGSSQVLGDFIAREYAESALAERGVEERVEVYMTFHEEAGEIGLRKIERTTETSVTAVVQETGSVNQFRFILELEQDPPHRIRVVNIDMV